MREIWIWMLATTMALVINGWCSQCCYGCLEEERIGLLNIKAWINDPHGSYLADWMDHKKDTDCCNWSGVVCENTTGRVTNISVSDARDWSLGDLYLNASLFLPFKELTSLLLSGNQLAGYYENQGLKKLEELDLSGNKFSDTILSSLSGLLSLKQLDLSRNMLTGSIGVSGFEVLSSKLRKLEQLYLKSNKFNDNILSSLSGFSSLKHLDLSGNMLTGSTCINGLRMLEELDLHDNNMIGSMLLQSLGALPSLKTLNARWNNFTWTNSTGLLYGFTKLESLLLDYSPLPRNFLQSIGTLSALKELSLGGCNLTGTLPPQGLCELKKLEMLDLSNNDLEGPLPACLGNLTSLRDFDVTSNQFHGDISPLTNLTLLESIYISSNHFEVPNTFKPFMNHSNLKYLSCSDNELIAEPNFQNFVPKFQLWDFRLSNCTSQIPNAKIPYFLYGQHDLEFIDLSYNGFREAFPSWLLENNTELEIIYLQHNSFVGRLLFPLIQILSLEGLDISNNNISGQIPTNTCSIFPNLEYLFMSQNRLVGSISSCFGNMGRLQALDLSNNNLSLVNLEQLMSSSLKILMLYSNNLDGQVSPLGFKSSPSMELLDIGNNHFYGMLPRWIGNLTYLMAIDLSSNEFEGSIPQEFCKLDFLGFFDLSNNSLSGSIPLCFSTLQISHVHLYKNRFSGPLTHIFSNSSSMVILDIAHNNFGGSIPNSIGNFSALSVLVLKANQFDGELPNQLCSLKELSILDVSYNNLSGSLPSCLGNLAFEATSGKVFRRKFEDLRIGSIFIFYFSSDNYREPNNDEGVEFTTKRQSYSYKGNILNFMSGIDLSCNKFTGDIPLEIGYLSEIRALNLSHNNLSGLIPSTFSHLKQIESLDMSYNNLIGAIPLQLTELTALEVFSVAYNNLSGKTPESKNQFGTFDAECYEGNPFLCGPPLPNSCSEPESNATNSEGGDDGFMDMDVFYVTFGVCYLMVVLTIAAILYINPYWRRRWFYFIEWFIDSCYYFMLDRFS